jgi:ligand-binding SRPBCC domain-containing protein
MARIEITTEIEAPIERCFDLARSIDAHLASTAGIRERAVAGTTTGLIGLSEQITWNSRHYGFTVVHTSRITKYERPFHFQDVMVEGIFRKFEHDHWFTESNGMTTMRDVIEVVAPKWAAACIVGPWIMASYLRRLIVQRNAFLKHVAESDRCKQFLRPS